jgi:thiol-disulfide isomerase/thioredoxin
MSAFAISYVVLWVLMLTLTVMVLLLYRHFGVLSMDTADGHSRDGVAVGSRAPALGVDAAPMSAQRTRVLLFASASCAPCQAILPYFNELAVTHGEDLQVVAVTKTGDEEELRRRAPRLTVVADGDATISQSYRVSISPFAFVVDHDGTVQSKGLVSEVAHLRRLLRQGGLGRIAEEFVTLGPIDPQRKVSLNERI